MGGRVIKTVGELVEILSRMDPDTVPISTEPPFDGIRITVCDPEVDTGQQKVLIHSPPRAKEDLVGGGGKRLASASRNRSASNNVVGNTSASRSNGGNTVKPRMPRVISVGKGKNKRKFK